MRFSTTRLDSSRRRSRWSTPPIHRLPLRSFRLWAFAPSALVGREVIIAMDRGGNMKAAYRRTARRHAVSGVHRRCRVRQPSSPVAGLTLAGASALSHDIFLHVIQKGVATEAEQVLGPARDRGLRIRAGVARRGVQGTERRLHGRLGVRRSDKANFPPLRLPPSGGGSRPLARVDCHRRCARRLDRVESTGDGRSCSMRRRRSAPAGAIPHHRVDAGAYVSAGIMVSCSRRSPGPTRCSGMRRRSYATMSAPSNKQEHTMYTGFLCVSAFVALTIVGHGQHGSQQADGADRASPPDAASPTWH